MQAATPDADSDARITRLEGIVEQLSQRMTSLETRMTSLETRMDAGFRDIHRRMDSGFRWIIGIQFTTLVALGTLILVKL